MGSKQNKIDNNDIGGVADKGTTLSTENIAECFMKAKEMIDKLPVPQFSRVMFNGCLFHFSKKTISMDTGGGIYRKISRKEFQALVSGDPLYKILCQK